MSGLDGGNRLRVLIVDDEAPARQRIADLLGDLESVFPNVVVDVADTGENALQVLMQQTIDVVFLDIQMPGMDGIEVARRIHEQGLQVQIVFVTAFDSYAVQAFDACATHYLLKPITRMRLQEALLRVREHLSRVPLQSAEREYLTESMGGKVRRVAIADILYFSSDNKYVIAHAQARNYVIEEALTQLEETLAGRFIRIHRRFLVSKAAIETIVSEGGAGGEQRMLRLAGVADPLPVSRRQWGALKQYMRDGH